MIKPCSLYPSQLTPSLPHVEDERTSWVSPLLRSAPLFMALMLSATKSLLNRSQKLRQQIMFYVCVLTQWKQPGKWAKHHTGHIMATKQLFTISQKKKTAETTKVLGTEYNGRVLVNDRENGRGIEKGITWLSLFLASVFIFTLILFSFRNCAVDIEVCQSPGFFFICTKYHIISLLLSGWGCSEFIFS